MSYMYGISGVPCLWENRQSKILFSNPFPKKNAQVVNLKNQDLDLIRRIHPQCGFYQRIYDPFLDLPNRNAKSVFGFGNPDLDFPKKTHPQTPYFLPTLTPALTFKLKLLALHERGKCLLLLCAKQNHYACKTMQKKATYIRIYIQVNCSA